MPKPELTIFSELAPDSLTELFKGRFVMDDLKSLNATVSLGILDLSAERADVVRRLNQAGIPIIAWLLLPEDEGYWFNLDNFKKAATRYDQFKTWTAQHNLEWAGIGLDVEPNINEVRQLVEEKQVSNLVTVLIQRLFDEKRVITAQRAYQSLVALIHSDGYLVESYHLPIISEERRARSTVLQRIAGLVDMEADREVLMLYSSFLRPNGHAVLWSYGQNADSIGVGNTGGGVNVEGIIDIEPLTWEEFTRDLRLCAMLKKPVHIFCLEGCVAQGFLSKLTTFDWDQPADIPVAFKKINALRTGLAAILWLLERPWVVLAALTALLGLRFLFKPTKRA